MRLKFGANKRRPKITSNNSKRRGFLEPLIIAYFQIVYYS